MTTTKDNVSFAHARRSSYVSLARIKEGKIEGADTCPEMSAATCRLLAEEWGKQADHWQKVKNR